MRLLALVNEENHVQEGCQRVGAYEHRHSHSRDIPLPLSMNIDAPFSSTYHWLDGSVDCPIENAQDSRRFAATPCVELCSWMGLVRDVEPSDWPLHLTQHSTACIAVPCSLSYVRSPIASPTRMYNDGMIGMLDGIYRFRPDPARRRRDRRMENGTVIAADVVAGDDMMWEEYPSKHPDVHASWPLTPKVCA